MKNPNSIIITTTLSALQEVLSRTGNAKMAADVLEGNETKFTINESICNNVFISYDPWVNQLQFNYKLFKFYKCEEDYLSKSLDYKTWNHEDYLFAADSGKLATNYTTLEDWNKSHFKLDYM
jgi:hypothetical protein